MTILALDTTGDTFSVAAWRGHCLAELSGRRPRTHLRHLIPGIQSVLATADLTLEEVESMAVTVGPGSFTGVRLGILTARTLAQTQNLPIVPLQTLEVLALNGSPGVVVTANDARRGELYSAIYRLEGDQPTELEPGAARTPKQFEQLVKDYPQAEIVGNAWPRYGELLSRLSGRPAPPPRHQVVRAEAVARLAATGGHRQVDWLALTPHYLRPPDVQVS